MTGVKLPKRPRQHELEDASRRAFERALPDGWVFRSQDADYGIDGEVEIFDDFHATGRIFKVQLKGTDKKRLSVRFPIEKETYFFSINLPILIVLHQSPSDRLYTRWFQSFDPYHGGRSEKGITLRFTANEEWTKTTAERLRSDVEAFYRLRDPRTALPLELSIQVADERVAGVAADRVAVALRSLFRGFRGLVRIAPHEGEGVMGSIHLAEDQVSVDLRNLASFTIHYRSSSDDPVSVAHDAAVAIALLIDQLGLSNTSARLLGAFAAESDVIAEPEIALRAARAFSRAGRVGEALRLAEQISERLEDHRWMIAALLQLPSLLLNNQLSAEEKEEVVAHYERMLKTAGRQGDTKSAAEGHHNLAYRLKTMNRWNESLDHYRQAAELDPDYLKRGYYHGQMAGALFLTGEVAQAAEAYGRAIAMGANGELPGLYADALMMSGQYAKAQALFHVHNAAGGIRKPEWQLKEWALSHIRAHAGDVQEPDVEYGCKLAALAYGEPTDEDGRARLSDAIGADGLCAYAWHNLGELEASRERFEEAFPYFLTAAVLFRGEIRVWLQAIVSGLAHINEPLFKDMIACAYRFIGREFIDAAGKVAETIADSEGRRQLFHQLHSAVDAVDAREEDEALRFLGHEEELTGDQTQPFAK